MEERVESITVAESPGGTGWMLEKSAGPGGSEQETPMAFEPDSEQVWETIRNLRDENRALQGRVQHLESQVSILMHQNQANNLHTETLLSAENAFGNGSLTDNPNHDPDLTNSSTTLDAHAQLLAAQSPTNHPTFTPAQAVSILENGTRPVSQGLRTRYGRHNLDGVKRPDIVQTRELRVALEQWYHGEPYPLREWPDEWITKAKNKYDTAVQSLYTQRHRLAQGYELLCGQSDLTDEGWLLFRDKYPQTTIKAVLAAVRADLVAAEVISAGNFGKKRKRKADQENDPSSPGPD